MAQDLGDEIEKKSLSAFHSVKSVLCHQPARVTSQLVTYGTAYLLFVVVHGCVCSNARETQEHGSRLGALALAVGTGNFRVNIT